MKYSNMHEVLRSEYVHHPESKVIIKTLEDLLPNLKEVQYAKYSWLEFILIFGSEGAEGLIGFIQWMRENDPEGTISTTIGHDVFGRNDTCFLPRSTGYNKYYKDRGNS